MQVFINNNDRFCYCSSNTFGRMQIRMENFIEDDLEKVNLMNLIVKQNLIMIMMNLTNNLKKHFNKNKGLVVFVNHTLLGFYLHQSV